MDFPRFRNVGFTSGGDFYADSRDLAGATEDFRLIKTLRYKKIKDYDNGLVRPSVLETDSPLYSGYKAVMLFAKIQPRAFPDEVFSLNYMPRVRELR